jgi:uncharacterized protein
MDRGVMRDLLDAILKEYALPMIGSHGPVHWARVLENGRRLAERTGANFRVVELFAVFHDARRINEGIDHGHGRRGAELAETLRGSLFDLPDKHFKLLIDACARHTHGLTKADVTILTCWDADRLDLGRVGIEPRPEYLCTDAAKNPEMLRWAIRRSLDGNEPPLVREEWGLELG